MDLSLARQVDLGMVDVPVQERVDFLRRLEAWAKKEGDLQVLQAIAQWRLRNQILGAAPD